MSELLGARPILIGAIVGVTSLQYLPSAAFGQTAVGAVPNYAEVLANSRRERIEQAGAKADIVPQSFSQQFNDEDRERRDGEAARLDQLASVIGSLIKQGRCSEALAAARDANDQHMAALVETTCVSRH